MAVDGRGGSGKSTFSRRLVALLPGGVETPRDLCLQRGLARELAPRERIVPVWTQVWQPREDAYIRATSPRERATYVVDGGR